MFEAFVPWIGVLAIVAILSRTGLSIARLYYENKRQERLERLDRQMQITPEQADLIDDFRNAAMTAHYPYEIGEKVLTKLEEQGLVPREKASYIRVGAQNHLRG